MRVLARQCILGFRRKILRFYSRHGRDLPFRRTTDPYKIAVAEIMLQQTQVERVLPKWETWIKRWPNWSPLSRASWPQLLRAWTGLGYNRRCFYLAQCARRIMTDYGGTLPTDPSVLTTLPGIGPYTANAILIFAYNAPLITIDTNIRRVLCHEFDLLPGTSREELESLARQLLPRGRSRDWHNALMDYAALRLPKRTPSEPRPPRQSRFQGSQRQIRGAILRELAVEPNVTETQVVGATRRSRADVRRAIDSLVTEGLVKRSGRRLRLPREVAAR